MFHQQIQHDVRIYIPAQLDADTHTAAVGLIAQICDTVYFLFFYKVCDLGDQSSLVYHVRKLCDNDAALAVVHRFNRRYGTHTDLAAAGTVCFLNTSLADDLCSRGEIRSLDDL